MLQIEKAKRSKRFYANNSSNLEQDEREQQQCNEAVNVSEADEKVCIGTVPADPEALATVEPIVCTRQHASAQPALQLQNCSVAKAHAQLDCESRDNALPSEAVQSGGAEPLSMYALRSTVLRIPFRMVSITNQRGHQGIDTQRTLDDRPATTLVPSELAQSASVAGKPVSPETSWMAGVTRDGSSMRETRSAKAAGSDSRQYEFANPRSNIKLSLPPQGLFFASLTKTFAHFQGLSIPPFLKGESKLMTGTLRTDLAAPPEIGRSGIPATDRSRSKWSVYSSGNSAGATFRRKLIWSFTNSVQFMCTTKLKEKNAQVSEHTHTLTDKNRKRVMFTPSALQDRYRGRAYLWFRIQQTIGRGKRQKLTPYGHKRMLIEGLIV
ncbi:uncharacterized protein LOC133393548 [Anopheles gambiae]|uniref:uncharacterized protein LOC133393548 n=1 Tax=Anopheles gambiae TaxID=7165 RepID=UPI002AC8C1FA|nr:uncharacterized protein LOC133393548 [Anopheles gambiae]